MQWRWIRRRSSHAMVAVRAAAMTDSEEYAKRVLGEGDGAVVVVGDDDDGDKRPTKKRRVVIDDDDDDEEEEEEGNVMHGPSAEPIPFPDMEAGHCVMGFAMCAKRRRKCSCVFVAPLSFALCVLRENWWMGRCLVPISVQR